MFFFTTVSSLCNLNVNENIIPHIPCCKVIEDNYHFLDASHLKYVQSPSKFIVLRMLAIVALLSLA